jgi:hypothetical protein
MKTVSIIDTKVDLLLKGSLTVSDLKLAYQYQETFAEAAVLVKKGERDNKKVTKETILKALDVRMKELGAFQSTAKMMNSLTFICKKLQNGKLPFYESTIKQI